LRRFGAVQAPFKAKASPGQPLQGSAPFGLSSSDFVREIGKRFYFYFPRIEPIGDQPVTSLALSTLMQISLLATGANNNITANTYADAYKATQDNGKPMVILVGAEWCPACQSMKTSVLPEVAAHGGLKNVAFACVNTDQQRDLAGKLLEGNLIPQLVKYEKTADGWKIKRLVGGQSVSAVEEFIGAAKEQPIAAKTQALPEHQATANQQAVIAIGKQN
jgi:thiol-disulfide isomerase/thioredoxin